MTFETFIPLLGINFSVWSCLVVILGCPLQGILECQGFQKKRKKTLFSFCPNQINQETNESFVFCFSGDFYFLARPSQLSFQIFVLLASLKALAPGEEKGNKEDTFFFWFLHFLVYDFFFSFRSCTSIAVVGVERSLGWTKTPRDRGENFKGDSNQRKRVF